MKFGDSPNTFKPRFVHRTKTGQDKFILLGHQRIHYIEAGQGAPLILAPGSFITSRIWNSLMPLLSMEYLVFAPEYPGGPAGRAIEIPLHEQTELIFRFVQQLELGKTHLIGGLQAGRAIFDFAARYPQLVDHIIGLEGGIIRAQKAEKVPKNALLRQLERLNAVRKAKLGLEEEAKSIKSPILYLYGTGSDYKTILLEKNLEYLKKNLPQAWIVALEGSMPNLARTSPHEIADLILEFLRFRPEVQTNTASS
jgi:pimeloyl-ACP methyl ester carboxylesterase